MTIKTSKAALWAAAGVIGAGAVGGVTYAAVATPAAASGNVGSTVDAALSASSPQPGAAGAHGGRRVGPRMLLNRLEHGELTLRGRSGDVTVDVQRGTVVSNSGGTLVVHSQDGFPGTYTVTGDTKVRGKNGKEAISAVHQGDTVLVIASGGKVLRVIDRT